MIILRLWDEGMIIFEFQVREANRDNSGGKQKGFSGPGLLSE